MVQISNPQVFIDYITESNQIVIFTFTGTRVVQLLFHCSFYHSSLLASDYSFGGPYFGIIKLFLIDSRKYMATLLIYHYGKPYQHPGCVQACFKIL